MQDSKQRQRAYGASKVAGLRGVKPMTPRTQSAIAKARQNYYVREDGKRWRG